ncbi:hypothetical protein HPB47_024964 [Ixodes persulcatus]|uniref:Uncharacterized protein n=1 Tax=Ixodes persulcatus TaxID=34615 RepID=A0AC60Q425_IXOPE|nr:hypothetical protein HPB47_024964 [Ixodes persulcatus]
MDAYIGFLGLAHDALSLKESPFFEDAEPKFAGLYLPWDSAYLLLLASIRQYCLVVMGDSVLHNLCSAETDFLDDLNNARPPGQVANDNDNAIQADDAPKGLSESNREAEAKTEC